jgi:hypothetical protein
MKPSPGKWSLGQVYFHLIKNTEYYIEQAKICLLANENSQEVCTPSAASIFANNSFPDEIIEGPDTNVDIRQPENKEQLKKALLELKKEIEKLVTDISTNTYKGKTKHPGLGYFSACDWLQFTEIHFRHHLRQKQRIDDFLGK